MEKKKWQVWLPFWFGIVMALGLMTGFQLARNSGRTTGSSSQMNRSGIQEVIDLIEYKYLDSVNLDSIEVSGIEAMLQGLDPHSIYISKQQLAEVNADLHGGFSGIGIEYRIINDTLNIVHVVENGPSEKAGLMSGDQIIAVSDTVIAGKDLTTNDLRKLLRGPFKSTVSLTYLRNNKTAKATITRGNIPLPSVDASYMLAPQVGYIRINRFSETTYREFMDAANHLLGKGMKKMVLDLRGNGGGILGEATNIADELLEDGLTIVSTKGLHVNNKVISSNKPGIFEEGPLVVLIDEFSASASEVLAGALQDNDRGTIMGRRSFGKGLVQEQYDLSNGGALRLTVARYFTPTGRSIQKPYNGNRKDYMVEVLDRHAATQSDSVDASALHKEEVFTTRKGKKVYGGGGITPDIVIAADTNRIPKDIRPLYNFGLLGDYSFQVFKSNQQKIRAFPDALSFQQQFVWPASLWDGFLQSAKKDSIPIPAHISPAQQAPILERIEANVARYVWRSTGFFQIFNQRDSMVIKALQNIEKQ